MSELFELNPQQKSIEEDWDDQVKELQRFVDRTVMLNTSKKFIADAIELHKNLFGEFKINIQDRTTKP